MRKRWILQPTEILDMKYSKFLSELWHKNFSNLHLTKLFKNKKGTKEKIVIGNKSFKIKDDNKNGRN